MKFPSRIRLPGRKWLIAFAAAVVLFLAYLWAGYALAPRLIRSDAMQWARARPGLTLALGPIKVDPLHWTVSVRNIRLADRGRPVATIGRLFVGLSPLSLAERAYHITALELDAPHLNVVLRPDGSVNLSALEAPATRGSTAPMPQIRIDDLRINQGRLALTDRNRTPAAHVTLAPVTFQLKRFRTWGSAGGRFALQASSDSGARLVWWGRLSMTPLGSAGGISLEDAPLTTLARFMPADSFVTPSGGRVDVVARYAFADNVHGPTVKVSDFGMIIRSLRLDGDTRLHGIMHIGAVTAEGGALRLSDGTAAASLPELTLRRVRLTGTAAARGQTMSVQHLVLARTRMDLHRHRIGVGALTIDGVRLPVHRNKDGHLTLLRFLAGSPASPARTSAPASGPASSPWDVQLGRLDVHDAILPVQDLAVAPAAHFQVRVYSLSARGLGTDRERAVPFSLRAGLAPRAYLALDGRVTPGRDAAAVWLSLGRLPLRPLAPYLPLARTAEVHSGTVGVHGFAEFANGQVTRLKGRADVRDFELLDRSTGTGLVGWHALDVRNVTYRLHRLVIGRARLDAPAGLIVILPNRTLNLAALMPPRPQGKTRGTDQPPGARTKTSAPAMVALLKRLRISGGSITFADESIQPHFHAPIDDLHGLISNVSTSKRAIAHIALAGQVINRYSPVSVSGEFNPYGLGRETNIRAAFDNIELPIFDPYSDRYAGYAIAKGKLSAHFRYRIDNRELNAEHHIEVDQLQWGGASTSKHRVGWPIRLATALLKDRDGVIRINLPVTGSLSNPDFHIASIVWTMLVHLLEKAALAPFHLIGKLFAGAQQAQYIVFQPGSAALPHGAAASLSALARGLAARPALQVDIPAGAAGELDAVALENTRIDQWVLAHVHGPHPGGLATVSVGQRLRALAALYRTRLGKPAAYPLHLPLPSASPSAGKTSTPAQKRRAIERARIRWLRAQLRPSVRPSAGALAALGLARAENVQTTLLAHGKLSAKRVFLTTRRAAQSWHGRVRLKLHLR